MYTGRPINVGGIEKAKTNTIMYKYLVKKILSYKVAVNYNSCMKSGTFYMQ